MSKVLLYLLYFFVYSIAFIILGKSSARGNDTISSFFVGNRKLSAGKLFFTFTGTWISAATILGLTGRVFEVGYSAVIVSVIPWFIGAVMLVFISGKLYENDVVTIPELVGKRYNSPGLQILLGIILVLCYVLYLVIQMKGFGMVAAALFGIEYKVAVTLIFLFIVYSTFGGNHTVIRTDAFNLIILSLSIFIIYLRIIGQIGDLGRISSLAKEITGYAHGGVVSLTETGSLVRLSMIEPKDWLIYMTMFFGWGLGLAANPQYMIRIISAKDKKSARKMILMSLVFLVVFYFVLVQIGLGMRVLFPQIQANVATDNIFIYVINNLLYSVWSGFFLISILGACISTANSQLLLLGESLSYDIMRNIRKKPMSESSTLNWTRVFILLGGMCSWLLSFRPPEDLLVYGSSIWGIFAATFTPAVYGTILYKGATKNGVWASVIVGGLSCLIFYQMDMEIHPSFPAVLLSIAAFSVVCHMDHKRGEGTRDAS